MAELLNRTPVAESLILVVALVLGAVAVGLVLIILRWAPRRVRGGGETPGVDARQSTAGSTPIQAVADSAPSRLRVCRVQAHQVRALPTNVLSFLCASLVVMLTACGSVAKPAVST